MSMKITFYLTIFLTILIFVSCGQDTTVTANHQLEKQDSIRLIPHVVCSSIDRTIDKYNKKCDLSDISGQQLQRFNKKKIKECIGRSNAIIDYSKELCAEGESAEEFVLVLSVDEETINEVNNRLRQYKEELKRREDIIKKKDLEDKRRCELVKSKIAEEDKIYLKFDSECKVVFPSSTDQIKTVMDIGGVVSLIESYGNPSCQEIENKIKESGKNTMSGYLSANGKLVSLLVSRWYYSPEFDELKVKYVDLSLDWRDRSSNNLVSGDIVFFSLSKQQNRMGNYYNLSEGDRSLENSKIVYDLSTNLLRSTSGGHFLDSSGTIRITLSYGGYCYLTESGKGNLGSAFSLKKLGDLINIISRK